MIARSILPLIALLCAAPLFAAEADSTFTQQGIEFFEKKIRPLLVDSCYECHSASGKKLKGNFRIDSRAALIAGGESGSALTPGDPKTSRLIEAVTYKNANLQMPPKKKLSDAAIADLAQWVKMGAPWPTEKAADVLPDAKPAIDFEARKREHWAWQPVNKSAPPKVKNEAWPRGDIDRYILAKLEEKNLYPSSQADPRTLIRRVTFDLTGLPPTAEEVEAFVKEWNEESREFRVPSSELKDKEKTQTTPTPTTRNSELGTRNFSSAVYSRLIDRLLASPHYGERWARHWLDVVRYADSKDSRGQGGEADIPFAYRYRDWVVDAFNRDLPYDQFILEQIAGDLLMKEQARRHEGTEARREPPPTSTRNSELETRNFPPRDPYAPLIATTMLAIGNWDTGDSDKRKMMSDIVDDQIDVISRGFLGMTIACARCHDHKFDPISTRDYYALAGFFFSSHIIPSPGDPTAGSPMLRVPLMSEVELAAIAQAKKNVESIKAAINSELDLHRQDVITRELSRIKQYLAAAAELHASPMREEVSTLSAVAARHGVHAAVLKRMVRYVGMAGAGGTVRGLFTTKLSDVVKNPFVSGWGEPETPSVLAYTGRDPVKLLTFTLPPRSIAMHPSPKKQVAIGWRSKITGHVRITGKAADADGECGNGIDWFLVLRRGSTITRLASGTTDNGGSQSFAQSTDAKRLESVAVEPGDLISLVVDAKAKNHVCDNTTVEFIVQETTGQQREWNLTADVVGSILASNPHADSHGNRDIWHFYAISEDADEDGGAVPAGSVLAQWLVLITDPKQSPQSSETKKAAADLATAVQKLATSGTTAPADRSAADIALHRDLITASSPIWSTIDLLAYSEKDRAPLEKLKAELVDATRVASTRVEFVHAIREGGVPRSEHAGVRDAKVHVRGRYDRLGDVVVRGFPALIAATPRAAFKAGESGRLELARWIASPQNPMTARVMMNRLWQHHFGQGLVTTPDNFGHLGDRPSHPELLDQLANEFISSGWSLKAMHRKILLSATYQQRSGAQEAGDRRQVTATRNSELGTRNLAASIDPENRLFSRQNRRRLDAEQLRDAMLVASGQLDRTMAGPSFNDISRPRRTLYMMTVRSDTSTFRTLFDAADPTSSIHVRNESTVAPQALFMLNHPFALSMAKAIAQRLLREGPKEDEKRIAWLYAELFARPATPREVQIGLRILSDASRDDTANAWSRYCQVLLCANEFLYVD